MNESERAMVEMHKDSFDRCRVAIQNHFYLEAILIEYAAIESRLEAICGTLGFPCGKNCECRRDILVSSRINCLCKYRNNNPRLFVKTKLPQGFFSSKGLLANWIRERNKIVHGLYKDEVRYNDKIQESELLAQKGLDYARLLYNEAKRIRRIKKDHPLMLDDNVLKCKSKKCKAYKEGK